MEVDLVINTPTKGKDAEREGFMIRRAAIEKNIGVITVLDTIKTLIEVTKRYNSDFDIENLKIYNMGKN
jgi:carbamoyl-phosphate synthase large subunit